MNLDTEQEYKHKDKTKPPQNPGVRPMQALV